MRILLNENVWDAALDRIRFLFDEFEFVTIGMSGGKDSTVVYNLARIVAEEKNRFPLNLLWIDQEAEWTSTVDYIEGEMRREDVNPYWYQMPILIENATSYDQKYLYCWDDKEEGNWLFPKVDISIKENVYNDGKWEGLFASIIKKEFGEKNHCHLTGVRAEESPGRLLGMTSGVTYKGITWGLKEVSPTNNFTFHPLYDWSYTDIWKAINDNKWKYNELYDLQYRYGVHIPNMRVSNLHHETAVRSLFYLQEFDADLYNRMTKRLKGVDMAGKMGKDEYYIRKLPYMFGTWEEYRDYLIEHLVVDDEKWHSKITKFVSDHNEIYKGFEQGLTEAAKVVVQTIVCNDTAGTKMHNHTHKSGLYKQDIKKYGN
tara:strand:+ start:1720 stop:2835 length:1116 start_codon:yes stop_codon:yes gene_type:complete